MSEWKKVQLGDVLNFRRGHDLPKYEMRDGDIPVAGSNGVIGYHNEATNITPCVTIGRSGNVGNPYIYDKCWAHNTVLYIDDYKGNDPKFIYYLLIYLELGNYGGGSAVPTLNRNHIHPIEILFPKDIAEQERIAAILGSLDDKIELNNKINRNLEAQAEALFKQWFVNFECITLSSIIDVRDGTHDSPKKVDNGKYLITSKHLMPDGSIDYVTAYQISSVDFEQINKRSKVNRYDILYSMIGTIGNTLIVEDNEVNFAIKNVALIRTSEVKEYTYFLYLYLKDNNCKEYIQSRLAGSTQQYITLGALREMPIPNITQEVLCGFNKIIYPIFEKINNNREQNKRLTLLRDTILLKLMNNEIQL